MPVKFSSVGEGKHTFNRSRLFEQESVYSRCEIASYGAGHVSQSALIDRSRTRLLTPRALCAMTFPVDR